LGRFPPSNELRDNGNDMKRLLQHTLPVALLAAASLTSPSFAQQPPSAPASAPAPAPANADVNTVVTAVQSFYNRTSSFQSDFQQEYWVKLHNVKKTSHGRVTFAKPGKMDWVYDDPQGNRVVSDGTTLRVYEAANRQMYEQTVDKSQYPAALSF